MIIQFKFENPTDFQLIIINLTNLKTINLNPAPKFSTYQETPKT